MRKNELQIAVERMDGKLDTLEMTMNSNVFPNWPKRHEWRALIQLCHNVAEEYWREQNATR